MFANLYPQVRYIAGANRSRCIPEVMQQNPALREGCVVARVV